jgi:hypothetical protein
LWLHVDIEYIDINLQNYSFVKIMREPTFDALNAVGVQRSGGSGYADFETSPRAILDGGSGVGCVSDIGGAGGHETPT